jgi:hypothetical protein
VKDRIVQTALKMAVEPIFETPLRRICVALDERRHGFARPRPFRHRRSLGYGLYWREPNDNILALFG